MYRRESAISKSTIGAVQLFFPQYTFPQSHSFAAPRAITVIVFFFEGPRTAAHELAQKRTQRMCVFVRDAREKEVGVSTA